MAFEAPTQSEIRTAKRQAVGGGRKRCRKGKNCSAACIAGDMACLVEMPESAGIATTKVAGMLQQRSGGGAAAASPTTQDKIVKLQERTKEAQEKGDKKQLAYLRHSLQGLQRNLKVETQALKEGRSFDDVAREKAAAADAKIKARIREKYPQLNQPVPQKTLAQRGQDILKELQAEAKTKAAPKTATPGKLVSNAPGVGAGDWKTKYSGISPQLDKELGKLQESISKLSPEQQAFWNGQINKQMNAKLASRDGTPYSPAKTNNSLVSQAKAWQDLINNGPPKQLMNRIGEKRPAPSGMMPDVTSSGQRKWISPDDGLKYSSGTKDGVWRQNRVSKQDTLRRLPDISDFRKEQQRGGGEWPTQKLPAREGLPKTVDEVLKGLSNKEKNAIVFNGLDATGNEGVKLRRYYDANPTEKEARLREIVQRWHDQGGRSGVSGKPVALPGLEPKAGEERSSVDHFQPISTNRAAVLPAADMRRIADNYKNFLIAEEGPNSQRGARTWDSWMDKNEKEVSKLRADSILEELEGR